MKEINTENYVKNLGDGHHALYLIFKQYANDCLNFIETGCCDGDGLKRALHLGINNLYSCDIDVNKVNLCKNYLNQFLNITYNIQNLKSVDMLRNILPNIKTKSLFWLDAHDGSNAPILEELELINKYSDCKNNTIIIDDIPIYFSNMKREIENSILSINPKYKIKYCDIVYHKDYVLVAYIED